MKVIKANYFGDLFPMQLTCRRVVDKYGFDYGKEKDFCHSELEIEADDIRRVNWSKYPCFEGTDYGVECPVCGRFVVIDENLLPEKIKKEAPKRK